LTFDIRDINIDLFKIIFISMTPI